MWLSDLGRQLGELFVCGFEAGGGRGVAGERFLRLLQDGLEILALRLYSQLQMPLDLQQQQQFTYYYSSTPHMMMMTMMQVHLHQK